ncbi:hypothetical protein J2W14_001839 [Pseudarthrobacter oxydans]|nr:hypothetical protein [Pseudarthrobacter oxydans]
MAQADRKVAPSLGRRSNRLPAVEKAAGSELQILRFPSKTGNSSDAQLWCTASSRTKHPEKTAKSIDFLASSNKVGESLLADRGVYPNSDVRAAIAPKLTAADITVVKFIDQSRDELGEAPAPPPAGIQEIVKSTWMSAMGLSTGSVATQALHSL